MTWSRRWAPTPASFKSEVSRMCADLDMEVGAFRDRDLSTLEYPYVFLDTTYCTARVNHRVVPQTVAAFGIAADRRREVLGFDVGDSENEAFWTAFLRSLKAGGLGGVKLVSSDAHTGLKKAINVVFQGSAWQRCRAHFMRNVLSIVPKASQKIVASIIRTAFAGFPVKHWRQIWSTNPMKRVNKEIKRSTDVVGVFPNPAALLRLAGAVLVEQHDEWEAGDRRYLSEASMAALNTENVPVFVALTPFSGHGLSG